MKIGFIGVELPEGKVKYEDKNLLALENKDKPKKVSPFFVEFMRDELVKSEAIVIPEDKILDILILDMEKMEARLGRSDDDKEKELLKKCLKKLEEEMPLCEVEFNEEEEKILKIIAPVSIKPIVKINGSEDVNAIVDLVLKKAGYMFFYTSGPKESHAWLVKKDTKIIDCAEKIHTDLARGFIRGDVVSLQDYMKCHNFNECKLKGLAQLVDRDYMVKPNEVIEIRFNV